MSTPFTNDEVEIRKTLRRLYRDVDGFDIAPQQERRIAKTRSSSTYGEIMPTATLRLVEALELGPRDVFVDLGSGVGKVALTVALASAAKRVVGVELATDRHDRAVEVLRTAEADRVVRRGVVELRNQNILRTDLDDATVVYTCSTAFPYAFTERIMGKLAKQRRALTFVSLQELDDDPRFELRQVLRLDMSWARRRSVHIYRVSP